MSITSIGVDIALAGANRWSVGDNYSDVCHPTQKQKIHVLLSQLDYSSRLDISDL
jgi:hypothetical protein